MKNFYNVIKELASLADIIYNRSMSNVNSKQKLPFKKGSLLFAPMEGVTDGPYRLAISRAFPEWDYYSTDFYRVPTVGKPNPKAILKHYGHAAIEKSSLKKKTSFQILTSARANTQEAVEIINDYKFDHLDLNLGCPSKKVNAHKGGAYLLADLKELTPIIKTIRNSFDGVFTVKIRIGYRNDELFFDLLKMFQDEGVEAITLHARTRDQLYQGIADWSYIQKAVEFCHIPVIGNGDIWTVDDIFKIYEECDPYAIMLGRGALKTPWLATTYQEYKNNPDFLSSEFLLQERRRGLDMYFYELEKEYRKENVEEINILKRFKSFSRYLFDDFPNGEVVRGNFLRSTSLDEFKMWLDKLL